MVKDPAPCGHKMVTTRWPAGEGSWEGPGLQGREVGGDQACRGGQLGAIVPAVEQLGVDQVGRGVVGG